MGKPLAFLLGAYLNPKREAAILRKEHPRAEYHLFRNRPGIAFLSYNDLETAQTLLASFFYRRHILHWALPSLALAQQAQYSGLLTTGEDVGLPMALQSVMHRAKFPLYVITHGSFFGSAKFRFLMALLRRMENLYFLCLSESLARILIEDFHIPVERVHNTGYGVDTHFFTPMEPSSMTPVIVSAGTANRDYRTLVQAVDGLGVEVKIAADSAWFPSALDIGGTALPFNIEVRSYGDYRNLRALYARASFVVVPLYPARHACGYAVIAEAMAMGKAVITTYIESRSDFVVDGETGYYVSPGDVVALREKMAYLLAHPQESRQMGLCGRARIEENYSLEAYCRRLEQVAGLARC
jgi:glycosyltransferase involved in cell wall biosynthesis